MKTLKIIMAVLFIIAAISADSIASGGLEKTAGGIKAVLKLDPQKSMVDLYLYDMAKTLRPITEAKVNAVVTLPGGKKVEKELMGMKMDGVFSYMNTLDMSAKGSYSFDISVKMEARKVDFNFVCDVK